MDLTLTRFDRRPDGIYSELVGTNKQNVAITVEHNYDGNPKIPDGTYKCVRGMHKLHPESEEFETFEITGVPGHTGLLFHIGNFGQEDSEGCVLVGKALGWRIGGKERMITWSQQTFEEFMELQHGFAEFNLVVQS